MAEHRQGTNGSGFVTKGMVLSVVAGCIFTAINLFGPYFLQGSRQKATVAAQQYDALQASIKKISDDAMLAIRQHNDGMQTIISSMTLKIQALELWKDSWKPYVDGQLVAVQQIDKQTATMTAQLVETHKLVREMLDSLKEQQAKLDKQAVELIRLQTSMDRAVDRRR